MSVCVAYSNYKLAALLFDHVVPVPSSALINSKSGSPVDTSFTVFESPLEGASINDANLLLPPECTGSDIAEVQLASCLLRMYKNFGLDYRNLYSVLTGDLSRHRPFEIAEGVVELQKDIAQKFDQSQDKVEFWQESVSKRVLEKIKSPEIFGSAEDLLIDGEESIFFQIADLPMIDTESLSWRQVFDIREDVDSMQELKSFRVFFRKEYRDMPFSHIEDDLGIRIQKFRDVSRKHGLSIFTGELSFSAIGSPVLAAMAAGSGVEFYKNPYMYLGVSLSILDYGVSVKRMKKDLSEKILDNPVRYIVNLEELSSKA